MTAKTPKALTHSYIYFHVLWAWHDDGGMYGMVRWYHTIPYHYGTITNFFQLLYSGGMVVSVLDQV